MSRKKENKHKVNKQEVIQIEMESSRSQHQQGISMMKQSPAMLREQQTKQQCGKFPRTSHLRHRKQPVRGKRKDPQLTTWKVITGILGGSCMILLTRVAFLLPDYTVTVTKEQIISSLGECRKFQIVNHNISSPLHCDYCMKTWLAYSHNCYYFGVGRKTWNESMVSCTSKNSTLLYIDSEEELIFLQTYFPVSWVEITRKSKDHSWMSKTNSAFKPKITNSSPEEYNCVLLSPSGFITEDCKSPEAYICKYSFLNKHQHLKSG